MSNKQHDIWLEERIRWIEEHGGFRTFKDEKGEYILDEGAYKVYLPDNLQHGYEDTCHY